MLIKRLTSTGSNDLHVAYRPYKIDEMIGSVTNKKILKNNLDRLEVPHSYLFTGPYGCGKTTAARILAVGLNCETGVTSKPCLVCDSCRTIINQNSMDVIEINVGQSNKKGDTEKVVDGLMSAPFNSRFIVLIMDEAHKLTSAAQELLLKIIEDGYAHVYFIFCTNEPSKLKKTFISRCNVLNFERMTHSNILKLLTNVCEYEAIEYNEAVLEYLVEECGGVPRDALVWLKQINDEGSWTVEVAKEISGILLDEDNPQVIELCRALIARKFKEALKLYKGLDMPVENVRMATAGYFTNCLKGARSKGDGRRFSSILDIITVPIYDPGKLAEHKLINYFFKVTDMGS